MQNPAAAKPFILALAALFVAVLITTIQMVSLGNDLDRLEEQVKQLSKGATVVKTQAQTQQRVEDEQRAQQEAEQLALRDLVERMSLQLETVEQEMSGLGSSVAETKLSRQVAGLAEQTSADPENLSALLAPSEKDALRDAIREELDAGGAKQAQILMDVIGKRVVQKLTRDLKLTEQQKQQVSGIVTEGIQTALGIWNAGTLKNGKEFQSTLDLIVIDMNAKIRGTLTTAQGAKFDKLAKQGLWGMESQKKRPQAPKKTQNPTPPKQ
ncbi:MAG: hypothetical protein RDV41_14765 [Planctomycetota bacterium]|nr:hypothetical protein [Planctomycetota bacterium]